MYNYSANPSLQPSQGITQGRRLSPMLFCIYILIIIIVILTAGILILGVILSNAMNSPDCEPTSTPTNNRLELTPEQVTQHKANFEQLKNDIIAAEGSYRPEFLHKREYYTRDILPPLTDEQKSMILDQGSGCTDQASFRTEGELAQVENGQWMNNVQYGTSSTTSPIIFTRFFTSRFVEQGRKKRSGSSSRSCGASKPAVLSTCIVNGGFSASMVTKINGYIQWVFHEDCTGGRTGTGCNSGQCCEIVRLFKAWVFLTGDSVALEKDIEVHTCDCANP